MREGKTLTRSMQIETRQHELFNLDLGEGAPRRALVAGLLITGVWGVLLFIVLGAPSKTTATLWIMPPALLTVYGWRESAANPRRRRVTEWALMIRWILRGHRPVIALGRRVGAAYDRSLLQRVGDRLGGGDVLAVIAPWRTEPGQRARPERTARWGRPAVLRAKKVQITGTATAESLMARAERQQSKPRKGRA
ncbi:hypothetical protein [Nostocoides vanveenii]|uniref:Uncharacterized protein n=1 Tax=Nostocoides vanveenii TaxID=330835 RepID=A0ABN2K182_9MICO